MEKGDRIVFLKDITEVANGDHPDFQLAIKGQEGTINEKGRSETDMWYSVYWDGWKSASFLAELNVDFIHKLEE